MVNLKIAKGSDASTFFPCLLSRPIGLGDIEPFSLRMYRYFVDIFRVDVETALVTIQIEEGVNSRMFSTPAKVGEFVGQMVKAVAERPNK